MQSLTPEFLAALCYDDIHVATLRALGEYHGNLFKFDYAVGRYISLERVFEESKQGYHETLEASSRGWHEGRHDVKPWLDYFWGALARSYKEFEEHVGAFAHGRGSKGDRVRAEALKRKQPFAISEIEAAGPGVSHDMVRLVLRAMKADGLIASTGKGRSAKWVNHATAGLTREPHAHRQ